MKKLVLSILLLFAGTPASAADLPPGARSETAKVNGIRMHYVVAGQGPLVVLLHGWPQTWYKWRTSFRHWPRITPSLPSICEARASLEHAKDGYDKKNIAEDVAALIRHLGAGKATVVGHDMGGKAAYLLGLFHPELVEKLVLVDCMPPGSENMDPSKGGMWHYAFHASKDFPEMLTAGREREYIKSQIFAWSHRKDAISEEAISEFARHYASPGGMTAGFNFYRALYDDKKFMATLTDQKFRMPVMTLGGRHSVGDRLHELVRPLAADLTGAVSEQSGHFVPEEDPEFVVKHLKQFLGRK